MALELLVGSATEAIFGYLIEKVGGTIRERLQSYLGRDPDKVAFKLALTRTLNDLTRQYPTWVKDLFDEPFLTGGAAMLLARYLQPSAPEPTGAELADAWATQLKLSPNRAAKYADEATTVSTYFLARLKHHLRDQKPLWDLLLMRDVGDIVGQVSSVQMDIAALRAELAQSLTQWQQTATTGGVNINNLTDSNLTIMGHIAGRDLYIIQQAPHQRACPTPPAKPAVFGGRDDELEAVKKALREGKDSAITALTGGGGIGKTTLAKQVAHDLHSENIFRSVLWVEVNQREDPTPLLMEWGKLAEEKFESKNRSVPALVHAVRDLLTDMIAKECPTCDGNRVLVVFDNVWSDGHETYRHLRDAAPAHSTILLTSRFASVPIALAIPNRYALDYLQGEQAVEFLKGYLPTASDSDLTELATLLGGYPLAMELAASRVNLIAGDSGMDVPRALARATQNYREGIPADHTFAELHLEAGDSKESNLTLSLAYSYNDLAPDDQRRFRQLGVLPLDTDFDLMLLEQLWEEEDRGKVEEYCRTLRVGGLIGSTEEEGWYRQHRLLRAYARGLLKQSDEFKVTAKRSITILKGMGLGVLEKRTSSYAAAFSYLETAYFLAQEFRENEMEIVTLYHLGTWAFAQDFFEQSITYFERILKHPAVTKYPRWQAGAVAGLAMNWAEQKDFTRATSIMDEAERLYGDYLPGILRVWLNRSHYESESGNLNRALFYGKQALELSRMLKKPQHESMALHSLGVAYCRDGEWQQATLYLEQALSLRKELNIPILIETTKIMLEKVKSLQMMSNALDYQSSV